MQQIIEDMKLSQPQPGAVAITGARASQLAALATAASIPKALELALEIIQELGAEVDGVELHCATGRAVRKDGRGGQSLDDQPKQIIEAAVPGGQTRLLVTCGGEVSARLARN
ncbi:MAG: hypothetical protein WKF30_08970 [Pyrinomonadaceae bacterium]